MFGVEKEVKFQEPDSVKYLFFQYIIWKWVKYDDHEKSYLLIKKFGSYKNMSRALYAL